MEKKGIQSFGSRGWLLIIFQMTAFIAFMVFTNFPMNILAGSGFYGGFTIGADGVPIGTALVPTIYTAAAIVTVVIQLIISKYIGKLKSVKKLAGILGVLALLGGLFIMLYPPTMTEKPNVLWIAVFFVEYIVVSMYATFAIGILMGQWFPRKKGVVMGIATLVFPLVNGVMGAFASAVYAADATTHMPKLVMYAMSGGQQGENTLPMALLPFFIISLVGFLIGMVFVKDYPEMVGAYRDNDKTFTPEVAKQMMEMEREAKRTTVWTPGRVFKTRDFWFGVIPAGFLLMFSVGAMTQTQSIFQMTGLSDSFAKIMVGIMFAGLIGSYALGVIDTKIGTKKSMILASSLMVISAVLGLIGVAMNVSSLVVVAFIILGLFMGASSNYTVSFAAQYWRGEDFSSVFALVNAIANLLSAVGPMLIATLLFSMAGVRGVFIACLVGGILSVILMSAFSGKHVKEIDDEERKKAGKATDDALLGRL